MQSLFVYLFRRAALLASKVVEHQQETEQQSRLPTAELDLLTLHLHEVCQFQPDYAMSVRDSPLFV